MAMHKYSDFFATLHDERRPVGYLGRGTPSDLLRAVVFEDALGRPLPTGHFTTLRNHLGRRSRRARD